MKALISRVTVRCQEIASKLSMLKSTSVIHAIEFAKMQDMTPLFWGATSVDTLPKGLVLVLKAFPHLD